MESLNTVEALAIPQTLLFLAYLADFHVLVRALTDCMVFNLGQNYQWTNQQGIVLYGSAVYSGITYGIWCALQLMLASRLSGMHNQS